MQTTPEHLLPLVSIGVASFNNARYLRATLDSIKAQDYPNWEVIIVDDCSTDDSVAVARQWLHDNPHLKGTLLVNERNSGINRTFNRTLAQAQGDYFELIGSDDLFTPHKTRLQVEALQQLGPEYGMCYSDIIRINEHGEPYDNGASFSWRPDKPEGQVLAELLKDNFLPAMGCMVRMEVFGIVGTYDESLSFEDWDMWLRVASRYQVKYVPGVVAEYRVHSTSVMSGRKHIILEDCYKILSKYRGRGADTDAIVDQKLGVLAQQLYLADSVKAGEKLWETLKRTPSATSALYLLLASVGVKYGRVASAYRRVKTILKST